MAGVGENYWGIENQARLRSQASMLRACLLLELCAHLEIGCFTSEKKAVAGGRTANNIWFLRNDEQTVGGIEQ